MYSLNIYLQEKKVNLIKFGGLQDQQLIASRCLSSLVGRLWIPKISVKTTGWEGEGGRRWDKIRRAGRDS